LLVLLPLKLMNRRDGDGTRGNAAMDSREQQGTETPWMERQRYWQLFTDRARLAIYNAQEEANRWRENYVGTEHLMLGLLQEKQLTPRARKVLDLAHEESQRLQHAVIGSGHLLLGLMRDAYGLGALVLKKQGVELDRVRQEVAGLQDEERQPDVVE